jgi:hypothetical protein
MKGTSPPLMTRIIIEDDAHSCGDYVAELDRLRAENDRLRAAAADFVQSCTIWPMRDQLTANIRHYSAILAALEGKENAQL